jgi:hypothetical protein
VTGNGIGSLVREGRRRLEANDYSGALRHLRAARSLDPESREVVTAIEEAERRVREALRAGGIDLGAVPQLGDGAPTAGGHQITPDEGFLLSRIDGKTDLKTILMISPMDPLEAQLSLKRLRDAGYNEVG